MPPIDGSPGNQVLNGTPNDDVIRGLDGADVISGGDGNDTLYGHSEADATANSGLIFASRIATGLGGAISIASTPSDTADIYVTERFTGQVVKLNTTTGATSTILDIPDNTFSTSGERGVLSVAFHPDFATNGRMFVYLTNAAGEIEIREYDRSIANPAVIDPATAKTLITIPHPNFDNHNGGQLAFGPDGYLYFATGDGGSGDDPTNNAQNVNSLLGKMLRIDVNSDAFPADNTRNYAIPADNPFTAGNGADEIWAIGLRNPFRFSFDSNGDLYIGDVGQSSREEIDVQAAGAGRGANYGWRIMEGNLAHIAGTPPAEAPVLTGPVYDYGRSIGQTVIGGVVNHGPNQGLQGAYVFSDIGSSHFFTLTMQGGTATPTIDLTDRIVWPASGNPGQFASFGQDSAGNVYLASLGGDIYRLAFSAAAGDGGDTLSGGNGNDALYGGVGNDALSGDAGDDILVGGLGADALTGGAGNDTFRFLSPADSTPAQFDIITDLGAGDSIDLSALNPTSVAVVLTGNGGSFLFANTATGGFELGATSVIQGTNLPGLTTIGAIFAGAATADVLLGTAEGDALFGNDGNDTLQGGAGRDVLFGGAGADTFKYAAVSDSIAGADDLIADFQTGIDKIDLRGTGIVSVGIAPAGSNSFVFGATSGGALLQIGVIGTVALGDILTDPAPAPASEAPLAITQDSGHALLPGLRAEVPLHDHWV